MLNKEKHKQVGCTVYSRKMNVRAWIEKWKEKGFIVLLKAKYMELYK